MDAIERLIRAFGARGRRDQSTWKLDVLLDLGRFDDPRVVAFLAEVVADADEPPDVRIRALKRLREGPLTADERDRVATVSLGLLPGPADPDLRLQAALALGDFVDLAGVLAGLGAVARDAEEPLDLRYAAFTSLQRAGPTAECLALLRDLSADEMLGPSARALVRAWGGAQHRGARGGRGRTAGSSDPGRSRRPRLPRPRSAPRARSSTRPAGARP